MAHLEHIMGCHSLYSCSCCCCHAIQCSDREVQRSGTQQQGSRLDELGMIPERERLIGQLPLLLNLDARLFVGAMRTARARTGHPGSSVVAMATRDQR